MSLTVTVVMLPRDSENVARTCGHQHRDDRTAVACLHRLRRRWPTIAGRIVLADSLSDREMRAVDS